MAKRPPNRPSKKVSGSRKRGAANARKATDKRKKRANESRRAKTKKPPKRDKNGRFISRKRRNSSPKAMPKSGSNRPRDSRGRYVKKQDRDPLELASAILRDYLGPDWIDTVQLDFVFGFAAARWGMLVEGSPLSQDDAASALASAASNPDFNAAVGQSERVIVAVHLLIQDADGENITFGWRTIAAAERGNAAIGQAADALVQEFAMKYKDEFLISAIEVVSLEGAARFQGESLGHG